LAAAAAVAAEEAARLDCCLALTMQPAEHAAAAAAPPAAALVGPAVQLGSAGWQLQLLLPVGSLLLLAAAEAAMHSHWALQQQWHQLQAAAA
jgi:hypothetical protein